MARQLRKMAFTASILKSIQFVRISHYSKVCRSFLTETTAKSSQSSIIFNTVHKKHTASTEKQPKASNKQTNPNAPEKPKTRKPLTSPKITLISSEDEIVSTTLENAEKLANRRNLKLVKIVDFDTKSQRPLYKLMTTQEYFEEDSMIKDRKKKEKDLRKDEKFYNISSKICENDLNFKLANIIKALTKKHEIHIIISQDGNPQKAEEIGKNICEELKDMSIQTNFVKSGNLLKFHFCPRKEENKENISKDLNSQKPPESEEVKVKATTKE